MRVAIAGAGAVGRSIAAELVENGHDVLLIEKDSRAIDVDAIPTAEWVLADKLPVRVQVQLHKYIWDPQTRGV